MTAASVELLPLPVGPVTSTIPFLISTISFNCSGRLKSLNLGGRIGITRMTMACVPRCLKMLTRKRASPGALNERSAEPVFSRLSSGCLLIADDQFGDSRSVGRSQLLQTGDSHWLQFARQFDLRRAARAKDQIADLVGSAQHFPQDSDEIWWRWSPVA